MKRLLWHVALAAAIWLAVYVFAVWLPMRCP